MRGVSKTWKAGYELSVRGIRLCKGGGLLPPNGQTQRWFPGLTSLNMGCCEMGEEGLEALAGLKNLKILDLGIQRGSCPSDWMAPRGSQLFQRLTGAGLRHLQKLPIVSLSLHGCHELRDDALEQLQKLPLTSLQLGPSTKLSEAGLLSLQVGTNICLEPWEDAKSKIEPFL